MTSRLSRFARRSGASLASLARQIGRRGAYLIAEGVFFMAYGWAVATVISRRPAEARAIYTVVEDIAPLGVWGGLWIATGALAFVAGAAARFPCGEHLARFRALGFSGLIGLPTLWGIGLGVADLAPGVTGLSSWVAGVVFGSLVTSTVIVAGWPEHR